MGNRTIGEIAESGRHVVLRGLFLLVLTAVCIGVGMPAQAHGKKKYTVTDAAGQPVRPKKTSLVEVGGKTYYVTRDGIAVGGWHVIRGKLCYANQRGAVHRMVPGLPGGIPV